MPDPIDYANKRTNSRETRPIVKPTPRQVFTLSLSLIAGGLFMIGLVVFIHLGTPFVDSSVAAFGAIGILLGLAMLLNGLIDVWTGRPRP